jgi:hypothetical protein
MRISPIGIDPPIVPTTHDDDQRRSSAVAPVGTPWMWTLAFGYQKDRTPTHGHAETREAAMTGIVVGAIVSFLAR